MPSKLAASNLPATFACRNVNGMSSSVSDSDCWFDVVKHGARMSGFAEQPPSSFVSTCSKTAGGASGSSTSAQEVTSVGPPPAGRSQAAAPSERVASSAGTSNGEMTPITSRGSSPSVSSPSMMALTNTLTPSQEPSPFRS
jgi:hypothetical protein